MKNIFKILLISLITICLFFGCSEDFLEKKPLGMESTATFYTSENNALQALTACYAVMIYRGSFSRNFWAFGDVASDDTEAAGEISHVDQPFCQDIDRLIILSSNPYISEFWRNIFEGINNCNIVISKIPDATFNEARKNKIVAEARFLRAMYHFYLNMIFGGIPLLDESLTPEEYYATKRASIAEILHFVEEELELAAAGLPDTNTPIDDGRATKGTARAYLLKALVFESSYARNYPGDSRFEGCEEKWSQAWDVAQLIINSGVYELEPDYADLWTAAGDHSKELIFRVVSATIRTAGIETLNTPLVGTVLNTYQSCREYWEYDPSTGDSIVGSLLTPPNPRRGWGLNAPTHNLAAEYEAGDPRFDISILTDQDTIEVVLPDGTRGLRRAAPSYASATHMNSAKYDPEPDEWIVLDFFWGPIDIRMFRYADVLLLAAEAGIYSGHQTEADGYINEIRKRARDSGDDPNVLPDKTNVQLSDIIHERRVELACEAHRYFDIVRWGIANERLDGHKRETDIMDNIDLPLEFVEGKHEFFPVPSQEIILSKGSLEQNPGY